MEEENKIRIKSIEPIEGTPLDYYKKISEGVKIPTFDDNTNNKILSEQVSEIGESSKRDDNKKKRGRPKKLNNNLVGTTARLVPKKERSNFLKKSAVHNKKLMNVSNPDINEKKDLSKMTKKEIQGEIFKSKIEEKKTELDRYIDSIVKYCFTDVCTAGSYFEGMFYNELSQAYRSIENSKLSKEEKNKLQMTILFGKNCLTEEEVHKDNLDYYDKLIWWAKHELNALSKDKKKEIVNDCLKKMSLWDNQFNHTSKIRKELEELKKKK